MGTVVRNAKENGSYYRVEGIGVMLIRKDRE